MSAGDHLSGVQFKHTAYESGEHVIQAVHPEHGVLGELDLGRGGTVSNVEVYGGFQRKGVATGMWQHAHELAKSGAAPKPKHSKRRTGSGDNWARKVGGKLPPLS